MTKLELIAALADKADVSKKDAFSKMDGSSMGSSVRSTMMSGKMPMPWSSFTE